jgi:hypothetical protein
VVKSNTIRWDLVCGILTILGWSAVLSFQMAGGTGSHIHEIRGLHPDPIPPAPEGLAQPENCRMCHELEYKQWEGSRHSRAATGDLFRIGFQVEPYQWCLNCHSPEKPVASEMASGQGVTCGACHNRSGGIATARPIPQQVQAHRLVYDPGLTNGKTCERCHQSDVPLGFMVNQDTMEEWRRAGGNRKASCMQCHMRTDTGAFTHLFRGTRDAAFLRRYIPVSAEFTSASGPALTITIGPVGALHSVPTGDPFRELVLSWVVRSPDRLVLSGERVFGRRPPVDRATSAMIRTYDQRLSAGSVVRETIPVPSRGGLKAEVRLTLRYIPGHLTALKGFPKVETENCFATAVARQAP